MDNIIPVFAAHDLDMFTGGVFLGYGGHASHAVDDDDAIEAVVVAEGIGAVTKNEGR